MPSFEKKSACSQKITEFRIILYLKLLENHEETPTQALTTYKITKGGLIIYTDGGKIIKIFLTKSEVTHMFKDFSVTNKMIIIMYITFNSKS